MALLKVYGVRNVRSLSFLISIILLYSIDALAANWSSALNNAKARDHHTATQLQNGMVLIAGGYDYWGNKDISSAEIYRPNPKNSPFNPPQSWVTVGSMSVARSGHTATLLMNGMVLVVGGGSVTAERFNYSTGSWSSAGTLSTSRYYHTATLLQDGRVLVVGGGTYGTKTTEIYNPDTNSWSNGPQMAVARGDHSATLLANGEVLVAGGGNSSGRISSAEIFDPVTNTWRGAAPMAITRESHRAVLLDDGTVLVTGGFAATRAGQASAERYDPVFNSWSSAGSMAMDRINHTLTPLWNGKVLVAGGYGNCSVSCTRLSSAQLYDPDSNTWLSTANLETARSGHSATILQDGRVVVVGGSIGMGQTTSAELFEYMPFTPVAYSATGTITPDGFTAAWAGVSNAAGYYLDVSPDSEFLTYADGYAGLNVGNVSSHTVSGLQSGISYHFRVRAYNSDGPGLHSNVVTMTTLDGVAPIIDSFVLPATSASASVTIGLSATDNLGVTGYCISETTDTGNCNWLASPPTSYHFSGIPQAVPTIKTLNAWAKDEVGNVSLPAVSSVLITLPPTLTVTISGTGGGEVFIEPGGIFCSNGTCDRLVAFQSAVLLTQISDPDSIFSGWSGACTNSSGNCSLSMTANKNVTATFSVAPRVRIGPAPYDSLSEGYDVATNGSIIKARRVAFQENLMLDREIEVTIKGGYDSYFSDKDGFSSELVGTLTIGAGSLAVDSLAIR